MAAEKAYALEGCADDLRTDGRSRLDYRPLSVELGLFAQAGGSARVRMGGADVIVGGLSILVKVMRQFGFDECLVSESDILDGLVASQLGESSG